MAYLYCNPDGVSREYSTINDALTDCVDGDIIMLDPGVYNEQVILYKHVCLRGITDTPENGDILVRYPTTGALPAITIAYNATAASGIEGPTFIFECIDIACEHTSDDDYVFTALSPTLGVTPISQPSIIFNRCRFRQLSLSTGIQARMVALGGSAYWKNARFDHCYWDNGPGGGSQFGSMRWDLFVKGEIVACEYSKAASYYNNTGTPDPHNYVTTTTSGYGPAYSSDFYIQIEPVGYFDGYVFEESSPVQRTVNLHRRDTGEMVNTTTSNPAGYYYMDTTLSGMHYIVALDAPEDPLYNDLIIGSAYPTPI